MTNVVNFSNSKIINIGYYYWCLFSLSIIVGNYIAYYVCREYSKSHRMTVNRNKISIKDWNNKYTYRILVSIGLFIYYCGLVYINYLYYIYYVYKILDYNLFIIRNVNLAWIWRVDAIYIGIYLIEGLIVGIIRVNLYGRQGPKTLIQGS